MAESGAKWGEEKVSWRWALRALTLVLVVPFLLVSAWAAFSLQGYTETYGAAGVQTWPIGVASLFLAAVLGWTAVRRVSLTTWNLVLICCALTLLVVSVLVALT